MQVEYYAAIKSDACENNVAEHEKACDKMLRNGEYKIAYDCVYSSTYICMSQNVESLSLT